MRIEALFPGISVDLLAAYGPMARPMLGLRAVRALSADQVRCLAAAVRRCAAA